MPIPQWRQHRDRAHAGAVLLTGAVSLFVLTTVLALVAGAAVIAAVHLREREDMEATARLLADGFAAEALGRGEAKVGPIGPIRVRNLRWLACCAPKSLTLAGDPIVKRRVQSKADGSRTVTIDVLFAGRTVSRGVELPAAGRWPWPEAP